MPKADDFTSGPGRVLEEPLYLNFAASRPPAEADSSPGSGDASVEAPAAEDPPLRLDPALRAPRGRRPGAPPPRPAAGVRSGRKVLAAALAVVIGLSVAGAFWAYSAFERHALPGGDATSAASAAPSAPASPPPRLAPAPAPAAPVAPAGPVETAALPAPAAVEAPVAPPSGPARAPASVAASTPDVARPARHLPRPAIRRRGGGPEALAATARANSDEAATPLSTLSAQSAAEAPTGGD